MNLAKEIKAIIDLPICSADVREQFLDRLNEGNLTRDENTATHFSTYFFPYNPDRKKVFIGDHKKAGLWIAPGGHIDTGESPLQTIKREIQEELGVTNIIDDNIKPKLLAITPIKNKALPCKVHYDIWYFIATDGENFKVDYNEYHSTRWVSISEARKLIIDEGNLEALDVIEKELF